VISLLANPAAELHDMLAHPFMRYAFVAGTATALAAGALSYFLVLRRQVFSGDAFGHVAFTGAVAALAFGADLRFGIFAACFAAALAIGALGQRARADDVAIGSFFAWVLGLGVLLLWLFTRSESSGSGAAGVRVLFGSIFGLDAGQAWLAVGVAAAVLTVLGAIARPLLFASLDEAVAGARSVPVRFLGYAFLVLVGLVAAEASQAVGALLVLGLLAAPGGTAAALTARPWNAVLLSAAVAVLSVWLGLTISYFIPDSPPSFSVLAVAAAMYGFALARRRLARTIRPQRTHAATPVHAHN
jgi:zinc/manganese transport system permease protein